jgi:hypothetical protein
MDTNVERKYLVTFKKDRAIIRFWIPRSQQEINSLKERFVGWTAVATLAEAVGR